MISSRIDGWKYNTSSIQESLIEKKELCLRDPWCKDKYKPKDKNDSGASIKCKHFYEIYFEKWRKYLDKC